MIWLFLILLTIAATFIYIGNVKKRRLKRIKSLIAKWGKPKENEYFDFNAIEQYFKNTPNKNGAYYIISEQTKDDLNLNEIFKYIDRTTSKPGQQYLYYKIRAIQSRKDLYKFDKLIKLFEIQDDTDSQINNKEKNSGLTLNCQIELSKLNSSSSYALEKLIHEPAIPKPYYHKYLLPLSMLSALIVIAGFFSPAYFLLLLPVFITNALLHYKTKSYIRYYLNAVSQLNTALKVSKKLISYKKIKEHFPDLSFIEKIDEIRLKTSFISFEKQMDNELTAFFWFLLELIKIQFNIEGLIFYSFIDDIIKKRASIDRMFCFTGEIDSAISVASLKYKNNNICVPEFSGAKAISIKNMIHPLIKDCIPNDIELKNKSLLLTGSNMSGKTTFIRAVAINSILSQTLNLAFAGKFTIPYYKIFSSIGIEDDLLSDTSYYLKEVLTIKEFIDNANTDHPNLFVLDEIFKGTNTIERISAGKSILSYLNNENNIVLVATHDIELTQLLDDEGFDLYYFAEKIEYNKLIFDYKLKRGKLKAGNALKILELYDYPPEIIKDAMELKNRLSNR